MRQRRRNLIVELKDAPCVDCGIKYPHYIMQHDHVMGEKKFNISRAHVDFVSLERLMEEIAKCDLVCANCHAERTFQRSNNGM